MALPVARVEIDPLTVVMLGGPQDTDQVRIRDEMRLTPGYRVPVSSPMLGALWWSPRWSYGWYELQPSPSGWVGIWRVQP